ncbi:MAG TPA: hypothetical protein VIF15_17775 [Polyangiaceae bacterium]|jgi:hypothetical protein
MTRSDRRSRALAIVVLLLLTLLALPLASSARADDTIKHPGDHPLYHVELEPHVLLGWGAFYPGGGFGVGGRASIPIVDNGFVKEINDSVAISFGLDAMFYNACWYNGSCSATYLQIPVVLQWNFFVAQHWSVFGEPGLLIYTGFLNDCPNGRDCGGRPAVTGVEPALFLGGRYHLSDSVALTMRIGFPSFSFGFSFFL